MLLWVGIWMSDLVPFLPVVIDMDGRIYARPWQGGLLSGGFEKNPKPIFTEGRNQLEIQNMQEDWDHFGNGSHEGVGGPLMIFVQFV